MRVALLITLIAVSLSGCAMYQAKTMDEHLAQIKEMEASGCFYFRGNSRPYADVSMLSVSTFGKNAPKWDTCLEKIPPEARSLLP